MPEGSSDDESDDDGDGDHLDGVQDGAGCTELWDHLSEQRAENADADDDD
jgi:hypothetical protein